MAARKPRKAAKRAQAPAAKPKPKAGKPAKPRAAARKAAAGKPPRKAAQAAPAPLAVPASSKRAAPGPAAPRGPVPPPSPPGPPPGWQPVPTPPRTQPAPRPFDPSTGAWLSQPAPADPAGVDPSVPPLHRATPGADAEAPDAPKKGTTSYVLWSVLLWADLALLALNFIGVLIFGIILVAAPGSEQAEWVRDQLAADSDILWLVVGGLVTFAVIPVAWIMGTRRKPIEGTKRFLHLHDPVWGPFKGVLLAVPLLAAVVILSVLYVLATQGPEGLTDPEPQSNPAVDALLEDLTLPLAILVALGAGIGEEIFFRGFLQRYLGIWGQAGLFGLAHSAGGYVPQILFALGLGVAFGYLVKRGWSLWTLMTAHAVYDVVLLASAIASR